MPQKIREFTSPVKVVVLGGGFCGTRVAKKLEKKAHLSITLIDRKPYFEYYPLVYKIPTNTRYINQLRQAYRKILHDTEIIIEEISQVTPRLVETKSQQIEYDILVIATGIAYPIRLQNQTSTFSVKSSSDAIKMAAALEDADRILVIGGGFSGIENAAELASKAKDKQVTLVHSQQRLLERLPLKASKYAENFLRHYNVQIVYDEKVIAHQKNRFTTDKGRIIEADLAIWSAGNKWDPCYLEDFPGSIYTDNRALKINQFLQLKGYQNIFVGGDVTAVPEEKTAQNAERHANLISTNIQRLIAKKPLKKYSLQTRPVVVALGEWRGILSYQNFVINGCLPGIGKKLVDWWTLKQYS